MKTIQALIVMCILGCQLQAQVSFNLSSSPGVGNDPDTAAAADVNGDGKMDLISANYYGNSLSVLTNNGGGGFVLSGTYAVGTYPREVVTADVNGDGKVDLICANSGDSTLSVLTNNGSGGFVLAGTYSVGTGPLSVVTADVNGDGKVDLITANWGSAGQGNTLTVLTNNGSGGFVFASTLTVGTGPVWVTAADVNGDGKVDLMSANWGSSGEGNTLTVLTNNGSGGFVLASLPAVGSGPYMVTAADVNRDGKLDLISANWGSGGGGNTLTELTNNGSGGFVFASTLTVGSGAISVAAADVNGDGKVDLISANYYANSLSVLTNNGSGGFVVATNLSVAGHPNSVTASDVNGDGKMDLLSPLYTANVVAVFTNATPFTQPLPPPPVFFKLSSSPVVGNDPRTVAAADVNGDGKMDLISANYYGGSLSVLTNNGSGGGVLSGTYTVGTYPLEVVTADVNGDGKVDLICANSENADSTLSVLTNSGSGGFVRSGNYSVGAGPYSVVAVDVNGDGKVDLVTANWGPAGVGNTLTMLTNNGSGGFVFASTLTVGQGPVWVTAVDVNGDGKVDLISANWGTSGQQGNTLTVLTNNGSSGFVLASSPVVGSGPYMVMAADVNGDGKLDLITANWGSSGGGNTLTVLTNNGNGIFGSNATLTVGSGSLAVAAADVNGDGKVDLISANYYANSLSVLINNGSGGFVLATNLSVGGNPNSVTAADVNGDGKVDLIIPLYPNPNYVLAVFTNATPFLLPPPLGSPIATGIATMTNGFVVGVIVTYGGFGYANTPQVQFVGGGGSGAQAVAVVSNGVVTAIQVLAAGSNYTSAPLVLIGPPSLPSPIAAGTATETNGFVINVIVTYGGFGYTNTPQVQFIGGGGSGAQAVVVVSNGVVTAIQVLNAGSGYTNAPRILIGPPFIPNPILGIAPMSFLSFSNLTIGGTYQLQQLFLYYWTNQPVNFMASNTLYTQMVAGVAGSGNYRLALNPVPTQAFATAQVVDGFVVAATVTSGGSGYVTSPAVTIVGRSVAGAGAYSSISGGVVTSITVTNAGYGYTNTVTIQIAPPPAAAVSPTVFTVMRVDSANLAPYYNYQIQFKPDVTAPWFNWGGGLFSPTDITNSQYIFITNSAGYFRVQNVP